MAKAKKAQPEAGYTVSMKVNGGVLTGQGATIEDAVLSLGTFNPKTTATITISKDGQESRPMLLNIVATKRLMFPGMTGKAQRLALAKRYEFFKYA